MRRTAACLIGIGLGGEGVIAQEKEVDPFDHKYTRMDKMIADAPETWEVMWEVFSVPFAEAAKLRRGQKKSEKIYAELVKRSEKGNAVLEEFVLLVGRMGIKGDAESIEEMIYPTEYEPPELPNIVKKVPQNHEVAKMLMTPAMPTAFDTKKLGGSLEVEFERKDTPDVIEVTINFKRAELLEYSTWGQGKAETKMPEFAVQGFDKTVFLKSGKPVMMGTMSPPKERPGKDGQRRVWFAFATAKPSEK